MNRYERSFEKKSPIHFDFDFDRLGYEKIVMAQLRYLFENYGIKIDDWSLVFGLQSYLMTTPANFRMDLYNAFFNFNFKNQHGPEVVENQEFVPFDSDAKKPTAPLTLCIKCHALSDSSASYPKIPFDHIGELKKLLQNQKFKSKIIHRITVNDSSQMPPNHELTNKEKESLLELIDFLSK